MPYRKTPLVTGEYYHIFNRGVAKMPIYNNAHDFKRFLKVMHYYSIDQTKPKFSNFSPLTNTLDESKKIVGINTYCLMPNHFHFLLKQEREGGVSEFMRKVANSYTKYFNVKYKRVGPLLQGEFKVVHIENAEQLLHVNRYIHLNPSVAYLIKDIKDYPWSSYPEYIQQVQINLCEKEVVLNQFLSLNEYIRFILDHQDYAKALDAIKHQLHDFED